MTTTTHDPMPAAHSSPALEFLWGRIDYERTAAIPYGNRDFKLDRMRAFLELLGNPQTQLKIVHVAGTKGKGSTAAMIAAILTAAGLRTGLYSSPHLDRVEERIAIDALPCTSHQLADLVTRVQPAVAALDRQAALETPPANGPTYFEVITAMALVHFAEQQTDAAVLEVGLGGRLDSTNVCQPLASVITSISFDHMRQLGNTLAEIAAEKAGIIKPGVPVVSGVVADEPRRVIESVAERCGSPLVQLGSDFEFTYQPPRNLETTAALGHIDFRDLRPGHEQTLAGLELGLVGEHQGANAAVALATIGELRRQGWSISDQAIRRGLAELQWPARIEVIQRRPTVVLDAAHNVASIEALIRALDDSFVAKERLLIFATTRDKDVRGMLERLLPRFEQVIFTRYLNNPRGVPPEDLIALAAEIFASRPLACADPVAAWLLAGKLATPEHLVVVTGSFFIAAEMRAAIRPGGLARKS